MDCTLFLQASLYFSIFISGFLVSVPVGVNRMRFGGLCILYGDAFGFLITGSNASNCDYPIYFGIIGMIIFGILAGLCFGYFALKSRTDKDVGQGLWTVPFIPLNVVLSVMTLVTACVLSVGISVFCNNVEEYHQSCDDLEYRDLTIRGTTNTGEFLAVSSLSQAGCWTGFLLYVFQTGISVRRFLQNRKR